MNEHRGEWDTPVTPAGTPRTTKGGRQFDKVAYAMGAIAMPGSARETVRVSIPVTPTAEGSGRITGQRRTVGN